MPILCRIFGHRFRTMVVMSRPEGYSTTGCTRCGRPMILLAELGEDLR